MVDFPESSLKDELLDGLSGRISESDIRFDFSDEVGGGLVDSNESTVVKLTKSQESEDSN